MSGEYPQEFGKYTLLEKIAMGGMAEIYRATLTGEKGFEEDVVIKKILPQYCEDDEFIKMFKDEARIAANLQHENIVKIYDFDIVDNFHFIAMEYVKGKNLRQILDKGKKVEKRLSPVQAMYIIMKIAEGLHYAHTKRDHENRHLNIIHRDVSPQNIMISYNGEVKLTDFGIAKAAQRLTITKAGFLKGKAAYISPEYAKGKDLDQRSDLFSLGICIWEMLTYKRLFTGDTDFKIIRNVLMQESPPPSDFNKNIPKNLDRIVLKALAKNKDDRYSCVNSFFKELKDAFDEIAPDSQKVIKDLQKYMKSLFEEEIISLEKNGEKTGGLILQPVFSGLSCKNILEPDKVINKFNDFLKECNLNLSFTADDKHSFHFPLLLDLDLKRIHFLIHGNRITLGRNRKENSIIMRIWPEYSSIKPSRSPTMKIHTYYAEIVFDKGNYIIRYNDDLIGKYSQTHEKIHLININGDELEIGIRKILAEKDKLIFSNIFILECEEIWKHPDSKDVVFMRLLRNYNFKNLDKYNKLNKIFDYLFYREPIRIGGDRNGHIYIETLNEKQNITFGIDSQNPLSFFLQPDDCEVNLITKNGYKIEPNKKVNIGLEEPFLLNDHPFMVTNCVICNEACIVNENGEKIL
jgi:serine/threonine protein kinase